MMSESINLKEIEKRAFRSFHQDGLWDLYLGAMLLAMGSGVPLGGMLEARGLDSTIGPIVAMIVMATVIYLAFWAAKKFITAPRIGQVKFGPQGKARRMRVKLVAGISVLVGLALFVVLMLLSADSPRRALLGIIVPVVYSLNMLIVFSLWATFWNFERMYLIGLLYALPLPLMIGFDELLGIRIGFLSFAVPAAIILVMGAVVFARFLREHPVVREELDVNQQL